MGWEVRKGQRYYYIARKLDGRVVREYVFRGNSPHATEAAILMADGERHLREASEARRRASLVLRLRVEDLLRTAATANAELSSAVEGMLLAVGYHRFKRGPWRMARKQPTQDVTVEGIEDIKDLPPDESLSSRQVRNPAIPAGIGDAMIAFIAPDGNLAAAALFARVRAGDDAARAELRRWIQEKDGRLDYYGDLAMRVTFRLVDKVTGGDPVWRIAVEEKVKAMSAELLGENPTVLDRLLVRRVVNGWFAVHALELESAVRPPRQMRDRAYLESAIGKAARRYERAIGELASVRRLKLPAIMVNVNTATPPPPSPPPPRVAEAEVIEATEVDNVLTRRTKKSSRGSKAA